ncbi:MAG: hypothetical protein ACE5JD_04285 [Candidatus Methylomirabilia bacterium]
MPKEPAHYKRMDAIRAEFVPKDPPVSTCFQATLVRGDDTPRHLQGRLRAGVQALSGSVMGSDETMRKIDPSRRTARGPPVS